MSLFSKNTISNAAFAPLCEGEVVSIVALLINRQQSDDARRHFFHYVD